MPSKIQDAAPDGTVVRAYFVAAAIHLRESAKAIDAINVYPVPDGDTGANMSATLSEAVERALELGDDPSVAEVLAALAKGALYGARGNSGVILSQALRGLATGARGRTELDAEGLAAGLRAAADAAYAAVGKPQQGTMLTVLRAAAEASSECATLLPRNGAGAPCGSCLAAATSAAEIAEAGTTDQLPALRAAGVTDAGGEGICVILRGLSAAMRGELPAPSLVSGRPIASLSGHANEAFGFCTEFMVESEGALIDLAALKDGITGEDRNSLVVVGDGQAARVHVHTPTPQAVIDAAGALGRVSRVKVEDMGAQNVRFGETGSGAGQRVALLVVSHGPGFDAIFRSLGAATTSLGDAAKPSAGAIAAAADALRTPDVVVLPNHRNVLLAAQQASELASCTLHVVPTASLAEGIAAAMAFSGEESASQNVEEMLATQGSVRTVEVTVAAADRQADGVDARRGEAIALVDGDLLLSTPDAVDALLGGLSAAVGAPAGLITIYGGAETSPELLEAARGRVRRAFPGAEVEAIDGGQPLYPFIASVE